MTVDIDRTLTFGRQGQIRQGRSPAIRVGWIEDQGENAKERRWKLRFTPASGVPGDHGYFPRRKDAKQAARDVLERKPL